MLTQFWYNTQTYEVKTRGYTHTHKWTTLIIIYEYKDIMWWFVSVVLMPNSPINVKIMIVKSTAVLFQKIESANWCWSINDWAIRRTSKIIWVKYRLCQIWSFTALLFLVFDVPMEQDERIRKKWIDIWIMSQEVTERNELEHLRNLLIPEII